ncbi:29052_t:CDS:2, partial [Gigaspora margarita]
VHPVESQKKRPTIDEALDIYYNSERSNDLMPNQDSIAEHELDNLLDGYLKTLYNLISTLQKGQKAENENKIYKASVYHQKSTKPNQYETRTFGNCHPIAVARNNEVTEDATKSAEVKETIYLSSYIKASVQEVYLETPCPSATIGDLESYYVLESSEKNNMKGWSSGPKVPKAEIGYPLKVDNIEDDDKPELVLEGEALKRACNLWNERVTQFRRTIEWNEDEKPKERNSYSNDHDLHINSAETEKSTDIEICTSHPEEPLNSSGPYNLKSCSQNGASAIKDERMGFELDSIKDKCSETKDLGGLDDDYSRRLNMNIRPNSVEPVLKSKVDNNCALIKMDDSVKTNGSNGVVVMRKVRLRKVGKEKKVVISNIRVHVSYFYDYMDIRVPEGSRYQEAIVKSVPEYPDFFIPKH